MACEIWKVGGATVIVCGVRRGKRKPCFVRDCRRKEGGVVLCDWILHRAGPDRPALTCDRCCCRDHARHVGVDKDLCLEPALKWEQMKRTRNGSAGSTAAFGPSPTAKGEA